MDKIIGNFQGIDVTVGHGLLELSYLVAALLFVFGLKKLSHPDTARAGNLWAAAGMLLAMVTTTFLYQNVSGENIPSGNLILIGIVVAIASTIGWVIGKRVAMTQMPQLVSIFNATGGLASALVAVLEYPYLVAGDYGIILVSILGLFIGAVAFSGSVVAYLKLDGKIKDLRGSFMTYFNLLLLVAILAFCIWTMLSETAPTEQIWVIWVLFTLSVLYGISFVMPIGGADMPVVISLLNALTGIAAAAAGFIYGNQAMILGGILVGAAGMILTILMCRAMNRSLTNVIVGSFGAGAASSQEENAGSIKEMTMTDAAVLLAYSNNVVIVPGYGLAVAQAQHTVHELDSLLSSRGIEVKYAIHPVAGRMPGHMNVLLAEADVPYDKLVEMDEINPELPHVDVLVVIGANDVVNPSAKDDPGSPIYGMPIIEAYQAKNIIVMKRGAGKGYAGIENPLFFNDKTRMLYGNAKDTLHNLTSEIKQM
ncbi:MAG TPA: NAD(P)(+) transhydrogenase (Re/Si-specific) subunit beta [Flavobacteriaceae bacterium]|nr:NAD(P)(+) transhydrogenase (Re/Si-specific) subunit beta [Flavobacteriaceae bacterium]